jgi:hypothetical protein
MSNNQSEDGGVVMHELDTLEKKVAQLKREHFIEVTLVSFADKGRTLPSFIRPGDIQRINQAPNEAVIYGACTSLMLRSIEGAIMCVETVSEILELLAEHYYGHSPSTSSK